MKKSIQFLCFFVCLFLIGCTPGLLPINTGSSPAIQFVQDDPNAPATLTPFFPLPPTPTGTLPATPSITKTPNVVLKSPTPTPTAWFSTLGPPPPQVSILVLGSDKRQGGDFRTDVIQLVIVRTDSGSANIVSFPRDLYVHLPGVGPERINTAFEYGGFRFMKQVFVENFGVRPDHYILTDFSGFIEMVDDLDGIDVEIEKPLTDKCDLPQAQKGYCSVTPGTTHMDGPTALWYARSRYSTSDFDRGLRAQELLGGILMKLLSLKVVSQAPDLYNTLRNSVETDMSAGDILSLVTVLPRLTEPGHIRQYNIGAGFGYPYIVPENGNSVFWPDLTAIQALLQQAMYFP